MNLSRVCEQMQAACCGVHRFTYDTHVADVAIEPVETLVERGMNAIGPVGWVVAAVTADVPPVVDENGVHDAVRFIYSICDQDDPKEPWQ